MFVYLDFCSRKFCFITIPFVSEYNPLIFTNMANLNAESHLEGTISTLIPSSRSRDYQFVNRLRDRVFPNSLRTSSTNDPTSCTEQYPNRRPLSRKSRRSTCRIFEHQECISDTFSHLMTYVNEFRAARGPCE